MTEAALVVENISGGYDGTVIVSDVSLTLLPGRVFALLGRNGMGKSTLMRAIGGRIQVSSGRVMIDGRDMTRATPSERCRAGLAYVPQERQVFRTLSVIENLRIADLGRGWTIDDCFELFPQLARRKATMGGQLSGGEQQMLAIARAMMGTPRYLLLDEPFEGLAPVIVEDLTRALRKLQGEARIAMLIVEQHAKLVLRLADDGILLERGRVRLSGSSNELLSKWEQVEQFLTIEGAASMSN